MENKKDIGKAFREKLDGLQKPAPDGRWDSISSQLRQIKKPYKFPWLSTIIPLSVVIVIILATYPLWKNHVPQIYIEMPGNNETTDASANEKPGDGSSAGTGNVKTGNPSPTSPFTPSTIITAAEKKQNPNIGNSNQAPTNGKSQITAIDTSASVAAIKENSIPVAATNVGTEPENTADIPDSRRGKLKDPTDYGADSLVIRKGPEKRDFSKIADSLNNVYGRNTKIRISFTIPASETIQSGNRMFYIQIVDPNNKVINEKTTEISGNHTLAYSFTTSVIYENKAITINETVTGKDFAKGLYHINVFDKDRLLTNTTFTFK